MTEKEREIRDNLEAGGAYRRQGVTYVAEIADVDEWGMVALVMKHDDGSHRTYEVSLEHAVQVILECGYILQPVC
ncbi:MAG: hypothetical protein OWR62_06955, partial [Sulfobacillus thermotolerans]|nr:hypothetical protein [Sulfobacillus thermotolerans]